MTHHGVKGQKWGIRRNRETGIRPSAQALNDSAFGRAASRNVDHHNVRVAKRKTRTREEKIALATKTVKVASVALAGGVFAVKVIRELNGASVPKAQLKLHQGESDKWLRQNFIPNNGKTPVSHIKPPERVFAMGPAPSINRKLKTPVKSEANFIKSMTKKHNTDALLENEKLRKWYDDFKVPLPEREFIELWPE